MSIILKLTPTQKKLQMFVEEVETRASKKSLLLFSDTNTIKSFLAKYPELAEPFNAIIGSTIENHLAKITFLKGLRVSKLSLLAKMCKFEALEANQMVVEENTPGDKLFILVSGRATVLAPQWVGNATVLQQSMELGVERGEQKRKRTSVIVADLKSGDHFGETALFVNINRTSTVQTVSKCLFVSVEKRTFENFCKVCPDIKEKLTTVMKERMVSKLSSLGIPFLIGIPTKLLRSLTSLVEIHETQDNEIIFKENDIGDRFFIIIHGQARIEKGTELVGDDNSVSDTQSKRLGVLNAGNYFGEMALVSEAPRSATVSAVGKGVLLSVDKESFRTIFASNSNALAEFSLRVLRGSSELKHLLAHSLGLSAFRAFMRRSVAEENVDFWIAANDFKQTAKEKGDDSHGTATYIFQRYCKEGSEHQVNLPCSIRSSLQEALEKRDINEDLFNPAMDEIYRLMVRDNYARFKRTPDFKEFFKCLGILSDDEST